MRRGWCLATFAPLLLLALTGCPPPGGAGLTPRDEREALARVNDNLARGAAPREYQALVSFRFRDAAGAERRFLAHEAVLRFRQPRDLYFDIRSLVGSVARIGSDLQRYWIWIEPEVNKLWWGHWESLSGQTPGGLPIAPNELLDALLLRPLPKALVGGLGPLLRIEGDDHRLLFVRLGEDGQPCGWREIRLDPRPPYQPLEIVDRLPDGRVQMHAELSDYRPIGRDGPLVARHYVVRWPIDQAEMRLDVTRARFRSDLPDELFEFPEAFAGEVEQLDAP